MGGGEVLKTLLLAHIRRKIERGAVNKNENGISASEYSFFGVFARVLYI